MKRALILIPILLLSGCGITKGLLTEPNYVNKVYVPEANSITLPEVPKTKTVTLDVPRDATGKPIPSTKIFVGMDRESYDNYVYNQTAMKLFIRQAIETMNSMNASNAAIQAFAKELQKKEPNVQIEKYGPKNQN